MSTYQTQGLVLSSRDFREADKIFSIYTDTHGKIEAMATGVRKIKSKLRAHLEPFSVVDLMIARGRRHDRLVGAIQQKNYKKIKSNYQLLIINYQFLETIDQLTKLYHPDIRIFNLLKEVFDFCELSIIPAKNLPRSPRFGVEAGRVNADWSPPTGRQSASGGNQQSSIRLYFILNFLSLLGYTPELKTCVRCKKFVSNPTHFSLSDGSVICEKCIVTADQPISADSIDILKKHLNQDLLKCYNISNDTNDEAYKLANNFLNYHLDRPLKSGVFVK